MTYILLNFGGFEEYNKLAKFLYDRFEFAGMVYYKFALVAIVTVVTQIIATRSLRTARWVLNVGSAIVFGVVLYSLYLFVRFSGLVL